jgi:hypothetical protein
MAIEPLVEQLPPALTPQPVISQPAPLQELPALPTPAAAPRVRERPQDAEPAPQPWSARSYAAGAPLPPVASANVPKQPASVYQPPAPPAPPEFVPPQSFLRPAALPPPKGVKKSGKGTRRVVIAALGLFLAAGVIGSLISRQNLRASQNKSHFAAPATEAATPVDKPSSLPAPPAPQARAPKREDPAPEEVVNPEISATQILNGPVRTLWESGRYAQALALVNQVLAKDPGDEDARSWKKKIREAQAAEAALK